MLLNTSPELEPRNVTWDRKEVRGGRIAGIGQMMHSKGNCNRKVPHRNNLTISESLRAFQSHGG